MAVWIIVAIISGMVNILNKMVNLEVKKRLGVARGTLLNYVEATFLSFVLVGFFYNQQQGNFNHIKDIPWIYLSGGVLGLLSMIFIVIGMTHIKVMYATIFILLGQLGSGYIADSIITREVNFIKILGIFLILMGVVYDKKVEGQSRGL